jgi:hypothetical protein
VRALSAHAQLTIFWPAIGALGSGTIRQGFSSVQPQTRHVPAFGSKRFRFDFDALFFATSSAFRISSPPFCPCLV